MFNELENGTVAMITIETNGINFKEITKYKNDGLIDWITVSPKKVDLTWRNKDCNNLVKSIGLANEVKIVWNEDNHPKCYKQLRVMRKHFTKGTAFVQPCSENFQPAVDFVLKNPQWRLSVQIQKVIGVK